MKGFIAASILYGAAFLWLDNHYNKALLALYAYSVTTVEIFCRR